MIDAVLSLHPHPETSGVTRFNMRLAQELGVPHGTIDQGAFANHPLLSMRPHDLEAHYSEAGVDAFIKCVPVWLHDEGALAAPLMRDASEVYVSNRYLARVYPGSIPLWCPGSLETQVNLNRPRGRFFTCGMAHQLSLDLHRRVRERAEQSAEPYWAVLSMAVHADHQFSEAIASVRQEFLDCWNGRGEFAGLLADGYLATELESCTYYVGFFPGGVRENNTTVMQAMAAGCCVITNLDEWSPPEFVHNETVLDIHQLDRLDPDRVAPIGKAAANLMATRYSWRALVAQVQPQTQAVA